MNENVKTYDTYRSNKDGKRYRVTEVGNETVKLAKLNEEGTRKHAGGRPRIMTIADLFRDFTKVNLPPVTVSKIEPKKPKEAEVEEVIVQTENEAQIEEQAVRELSTDDIKAVAEKSAVGIKEATHEINKAFESMPKKANDIVNAVMTDEVRKKLDALDELEKPSPEPHTLEDTFEEFREKNQSNVKNVTVTVDGREIREQITHEKELDVLKAELKEKLQECIEHKKTISKMHDQITSLAKELNDSRRECLELRGTISKMKHQHQAEVADLNDHIMEAEAEANAIRKHKDEILKKHVEYADALDDDSVAFEAILDLAHIAQSVSQSLYKVSKRIEAETEGRI